MLYNKPITFEGTDEQAEINRRTHNFITFDSLNYNCADCDCKPYHAAAKYPCGQEPERETISIKQEEIMAKEKTCDEITAESLFLEKLEELLREFNASICFELDEDSDTYGIFGERMVVTVGRREVRVIDGYVIDAAELV
jgi:hypothetical protein